MTGDKKIFFIFHYPFEKNETAKAPRSAEYAK